MFNNICLSMVGGVHCSLLQRKLRQGRSLSKMVAVMKVCKGLATCVMCVIDDYSQVEV